MYERMLDRTEKPTETAFIHYCGEAETLFENIDAFLLTDLGTGRMLRFPYGNRYGWGMKYYIKSKHVCDIFAEKDAFTVMLRMTDPQFEEVYSEVTADTKEYIDQRYPCGEGGWIHYRVSSEQHLDDAKKLLRCKVQKKVITGRRE